MSWRSELNALTAAVPPGELADLVGELARLDVLVRQRIAENGKAESQPSTEPDRYLTAVEAAKILKVSPDWLYRRAGRLPFGHKLSPHVTRFSERELRRWMATRAR